MATGSMVDNEVDRLLKEGKAAAKRGDKGMARALLTQVVEGNPHSEDAWMWLSGVVGDPQEQQICLENVLVINPFNAQARKGLEYISTKTGIAPRIPPLPNAPASERTSPLTADPHVYTTQQPQQPPDLSAYELPPAPPDEPEENGVAPMPRWMQTDQLDTVRTDDGSSAPAFDFWSVGAGSPDPAGPLASSEPINGNADQWAVPGLNSPQGSQDSNEAEPGHDALSYEPFSFSSIRVPAPEPEADLATGGPGLAQDMAEANRASSARQEWAFSLTDDGPVPGQQPTHGGPQSPFDPFEPFGAPGGNGAHDMDPVMGGPFGAFGSGPSPMGPYGDAQLPSPSELPGSNFDPTGELQPWYLRSSTSNAQPPAAQVTDAGSSYASSPVAEQAQADEMRGGATAIVTCPNCKEQTPDTALACPRCRFNFFVHCPKCHEIIDASDAVPGQTEPCPYCGTSVDKMELGLVGSTGAVDYQSTPTSGRRGVEAFPAMQHLSSLASPRKRVGFGWIVDVLWLSVIIVTIWALTQLPTWLHLTGQY